ncbi:murein hydrolase activator EnvC family protein [Sphingomonas xanthus]|uniref:Peptidoglycan DD-metalloendopeptidase family protein n=1 Tax=Sphingomonas xanthus TaxID=2594473 RepID=A0A516IQV0_9SPHN|nr:peptidoglycan DD-metalloendopeptidase family protein [Sphingomonas xanthus]QDP19249.1 peptidoglycan DD-metalloendopeptidase family protein [Sphingomonas xanthus]
MIDRPLLLLLGAALAAMSGPVRPLAPSADQALNVARAEAARAARRLVAVEAETAKAETEVARLSAERAAGAAAIEDAEARISEAQARFRLARAQVALGERRLFRRRAPLASLIAGLATMGRQPPLLSLADRGSVDELVRMRALLDATMPVIEQRSAALRQELERRQARMIEAREARADVERVRNLLAERQRQFAALEARAGARSARLLSETIGAGDRLLATQEQLAEAGNDAAARRSALRSAEALAKLSFAPARPMRGDSGLPPLDFAYSLPVDAPLEDGLGSISDAGIASRGLHMATRRGTMVRVPADGTILFAAPYRGHDGVVIIDHGKGWTSLLLGVASDHPRGSKLVRGQPLGRTLGPIGVELRQDGRAVSPAFIAASSPPLSNGANNR